MKKTKFAFIIFCICSFVFMNNITNAQTVKENVLEVNTIEENNMTESSKEQKDIKDNNINDNKVEQNIVRENHTQKEIEPEENNSEKNTVLENSKSTNNISDENVVIKKDIKENEVIDEKIKNRATKTETDTIKENVNALSVNSKQQIIDGIYQIELGINSNKVIEVENAANFSGANVQIFSRNNAMCQRVEIKNIGQGYYTIKFVHSGKYLDVANGQKKNSTNVWQCTKNNSDAQKWKIISSQDGYYQFISKCSNTYLTVAGGNNKNCTNIEINSNKNDKSQKFKLKEIKPLKGEKTIEDGVYNIELSLNKSKVLEVINATKYSGANVQIFGNNGSKCQKVNVKYIGDGYYTIQFRHSGLYLDVADAGTANGTNVWQCTKNNSDAQKWIINKTNDGYYQIISKCSETYLTVAGGKMTNCTNIEMNTLKSDKSQRFSFKKQEIVKGEQIIQDGSYEIGLCLDNKKVIEVAEAYTYSGANVQIFNKNNVPCQTVEIKYVGNGYYTIKFKHSGRFLDVANGETANGTNVWQCTQNNSDAQKWIINKTTEGYYQFISKCSETYLTVAGGRTTNCTNIEINTKKNDKSQNFTISNSKVITGIDVSKHQREIDWEKVKKSGISFAIIRCGYGENIESQDDSKYFRNISECERIGIPYGIYIYSYALNVNGAKSEAEHVLRLVKGHNPTMGIWFDMEDADEYKLRNGMPSNETLINICTTFCDIIKSKGYKVGIYASRNWMYEKLNNDTRLDKYEKWIAQWGTTCTYTKNYKMWQYSSQGIVEGIKGYVDMNRYYL